jgi:hypothetical protein
LHDEDRYRLWHGPYQAPRFRYGRVVWCEVRGEVTICGLTDAPIPWPVGIKGSNRALVIYGALAKAVRTEANQAVAHWWGVTPQTVTKWRKAMEVGPTTEGTSKLRSAYSQEEWFVEAAKKAHAKARDPQRRAKIAAAKRGKMRPKHVVEAMRQGRAGKGHSPEARGKMRAAALRNGSRSPKAGRAWTTEEDELLRTLPAQEVARRTGRSLTAVYSRRRKLGLPDGRRNSG